MFSLKNIIDYLESQPDQHKRVPLGWNAESGHSYRGYYIDCAFSPVENVTVAQMLAGAKRALGTTYTGWGGGQFETDEWTVCWLAEQGDDSGQSIGLALLDYMLGKYDTTKGE